MNTRASFSFKYENIAPDGLPDVVRVGKVRYVRAEPLDADGRTVKAKAIHFPGDPMVMLPEWLRATLPEHSVEEIMRTLGGNGLSEYEVDTIVGTVIAHDPTAKAWFCHNGSRVYELPRERDEFAVAMDTVSAAELVWLGESVPPVLAAKYPGLAPMPPAEPLGEMPVESGA